MDNNEKILEESEGRPEKKSEERKFLHTLANQLTIVHGYVSKAKKGVVKVEEAEKTLESLDKSLFKFKELFATVQEFRNYMKEKEKENE